MKPTPSPKLPLPQHVRGVLITINLMSLPDYYAKNNLEAKREKHDFGKPFPVIVLPASMTADESPVQPAGFDGQLRYESTVNNPAGVSTGAE